jgi:hypothetical protein
MMHNELSRTCRTGGWTWTITDGKINIAPFDGYLAGEAIVVNSRSGMVGWPEQTPEGIEVTMLLNPAIRVGNLVKINNRDINTSYHPGGTFQPIQGIPTFATLELLQPTAADDGYYVVVVVEHIGDTRGNDWYTKLVCLMADMSASAGAGAGAGAGGRCRHRCCPDHHPGAAAGGEHDADPVGPGALQHPRSVHFRFAPPTRRRSNRSTS